MYFSCFLLMIFVHWQHIMLKKTDGEIVCFFNCENGLLRKPYVLFLVKFWSAFKAQVSSTDDKGHTKMQKMCLLSMC